MEDKELLELFEAKRTVEANRRRQEELAAMIGRQGRHHRHLWPVWAGAAAASVALLLFLLSPLFRHDTVEPTLVAHTITPEAPMPQEEESVEPAAAPIHHTAKPAPAVPSPTVPAEPIAAESPEALPEPESLPAVEQPAEAAPAIPTRRVMRRTSTLLACTKGCPEPEGTQEPTKKNIHIEFFGSQQLAEAAQYTIMFNK